MKPHRPFAFVLRLALAAATLALAGCLTNPAIEQGEEALAAGRLEEGIALLEKAAAAEPGDLPLRGRLAREKLAAAHRHALKAEEARAEGRLDEAEAGFRRVLVVEPGFPRARQGLEQIAIDRRHQQLVKDADAALKKKDSAGAETLLRTVLAQDPGHREARRLMNAVEQARVAADTQERVGGNGPGGKPVTLEFREAPLKTVFEVLSRNSGVNFVFDKDVKADAKVTIFVRNTALDEVIRLILATNQLERRQLNDNAFLIYPNTAVKAKDYQELALRTFYLANADAKQVQALLKTVLKVKDVHLDEKLNLLVVRDTPQAIVLAEKLVQSVDLAEPEVMLELEVLEVVRSRLDALGVRWPETISYGNAAAASGTNLLLSATGLRGFTANPMLVADIKGTKGESNLLANPRIRVRNREKAKVHIGDKLPVFTTTSTANVGVSASVNYLDVGLKLDVEPQVYLEDDVAIKVGLEVSSVVKEVTGPEKSLAYQVGTRSTSTTLRLKNGETQVLAGLINDEERSSSTRIPGFGDIPLVGRLFGSQSDQHNKTEIILLVTPRVVRNLAPADLARATLPAGTENLVGMPPLTVKNAAPNSLSMSAPGGAGAAVRGGGARGAGASRAAAASGDDPSSSSAPPADQGGETKPEAEPGSPAESKPAAEAAPAAAGESQAVEAPAGGMSRPLSSVPPPPQVGQ